jgi:hypothetical protein
MASERPHEPVDRENGRPKPPLASAEDVCAQVTHQQQFHGLTVEDGSPLPAALRLGRMAVRVVEPVWSNVALYIGGRMPHAWLERGGRVYAAVVNRFFDADAFVRMASPTPLATYTIMEAAHMVASSRHFGAWIEPPGENWSPLWSASRRRLNVARRTTFRENARTGVGHSRTVTSPG